MKYQLPSQVKILRLKSLGKQVIHYYTITDDVQIGYTTATLWIKGLVGSDFKMRLNLYFDVNGTRKILTSTTISNSDLQREGSDYYCEVRFDWPKEKNLLTINHQYMMSFELFGDYPFDANNYIGLVINYLDKNVTLDPIEYIASGGMSAGLRFSTFFFKA